MLGTNRVFARAVINTISVLVLSWFFIACGGGNSNDTPSSNSKAQPTAAIDTSSGAGLASSAMSSRSSVTTGSTLFISPSNTSPTPLTLAAQLGGAVLQPDTSTMSVTQQLSAGILCTTGSVTFPPANSTSGTITFTNCNMGGIGLFLNGSISYTASYSSGGFSASLTYNGFSFSDSTQILATLNGMLNLSFSLSNTGWSYSSSSNNFSATFGTENVTYADYSISDSYDSVTGDLTSAFNYAVTSDSLGGTVIVTTDPAQGGQPVVTNQADIYPYQGTVIIIGANNDRIRISANGDGSPTGTVTIEYALDGDGVYDDGTENISWQEFGAMAIYSLALS